MFKEGDVVYWNDSGQWYKATITDIAVFSYGGDYYRITSDEFSKYKWVHKKHLVLAEIYESPLHRALA